MNVDYDKLIDVLKNNKKFLICSHAHPDGDGIGSTLALGLALKKMGKDVLMYNQDPVPRSIDFLPAADQMVTSIDKDAKFDVTIMVDCGQPERAGKDFPPEARRGTLVCIDHHMTRCEHASVTCADEEASSTGEVVYKILKKLGADINTDVATLILTTLIVDTNFFRYSNTSGHTLSLAGELVSMGASTWNVSKNMEERVPPESLTLLTAALQTIDYLLDGKLAIMLLTQQMFKNARADVEMAEEFINYPRSIDGVEVAALIREKKAGEWKISFRSKDTVDVAAVAMKFGGGGHEHAAGCDIKGSLGEVKQIVVRAVEEALLK